MSDKVVGILGGGQLGQMMVEAANPLSIKTVILDKPGAPAKQINAKHPHINGSFKTPSDIVKLARESDVLTVEIEHVDTHVLQQLEEGKCEGLDKKVNVQPNWRTIRVIQDKFLQKDHLASHKISTTESAAVDSTIAALEDIGGKFGYPFMLKSRKEAYDGRGNFPVKSAKSIPDALKALNNRGLYAEKWSNFKCELAVMVVKTKDEADSKRWQETTLGYPVVETIHEDSICKLVYAPARGVSKAILHEAKILAQRAVASFWGKGVFGVEMFLQEDDTLLLNEIAPRPHNSGHYTIEACRFSQYTAHLKAILDIPIPQHAVDFHAPGMHSIMLNILGGAKPTSHLALSNAAANAGAAVHLYGKGPGTFGRKMGHVTVTAGSLADAEAIINPLVAIADRIRAGEHIESEITYSISENVVQTPLVAVTMGSDSDLPVLKPGLAFLEEMGIPFHVTITSAHRTPDRMVTFAREAAEKGFKVIIAAAGGAAHLPGMVASCSVLPVIGVPVKPSSSNLGELSSLLSIVDMPKGVPVATVGINNSTNAAILAARILGATDLAIRAKLEKYIADMESGVLAKADKLESTGFRDYGL